MLDFEEISLGHQDLPSNKYYSTVNVGPSPVTMDMLLSAGDSLSFQEMLDLDIKSEIDTVLGCGGGEFTSFSFTDLPPLELDDTPASDINMWFSSTSNHSNSNFNIDFIGSEAAAMMVNPNSVMPLTLVTVPTKSTSPAVGVAQSKTSTTASNGHSYSATELKTEIVKKDISVEKRPIGKTIKVTTPFNGRSVVRTEVKSQHSLLNIKSAIQKQLSTNQFNGIGSVRVVQTARKQHYNNRHYSEDEKAYPKPAYSYSCLIAMALKNSRTGSLPVSEIYNFMCEHFPYFKTAPNGWKNSVRHNLSLNKCFEKIEKPAVTGAQRKGCLWAMNPAKISKMDEEVQKWSRKDPTAIRKAMVNPEHLESLERGELKYTCRSSDLQDTDTGDSSADTEEEEEEGSDVEVEDSRTDLEEIDYVQVTRDDECGFDIEVADTLYENDSDQNTIKIEMELVDDDLIRYDTPSKKRSRSILELDEDFTGTRLYQVQTPSRRKTAYLIKNE
ncbi:jumeau [Carabus blaptoides fortunei]